MLARVAVIVAFLSVAVGAGCGDEVPTAGTSSAVGASTVVRPATTVLVAPDPSAPPVLSLPPIAVTEPCPPSASVDGDGQGMTAEQSRLEPMLGEALAYGSQHADQFGTYGLIWHEDGSASVFVSFTADLDVHRAALEPMVEHREDLIVCQVAINGSTAQALQSTLAGELEGRFMSIGSGGTGPLEVTLAANEEELAGELVARYGSSIAVRVGALAYPIGTASSVCVDAPPASTVPGLRIGITAPTEPLSAAGVEPAQLTVVLHNDGDTPIRFSSGTAVGTILDGTGRVVSALVANMADVGIAVDLRPGTSTELPLVVSTASCDPAIGYTLPPGPYRLTAGVHHADGESTTLHSPPVPITIGDEEP
jgi:hypothetical protein